MTNIKTTLIIPIVASALTANAVCSFFLLSGGNVEILALFITSMAGVGFTVWYIMNPKITITKPPKPCYVLRINESMGAREIIQSNLAIDFPDYYWLVYPPKEGSKEYVEIHGIGDKYSITECKYRSLLKSVKESLSKYCVC